MIKASFSGHTHFDDYRLLIDQRGTVIGLDKMTPALSPIFGQNLAFQVFTYDKQSGAPTDLLDLASSPIQAQPPRPRIGGSNTTFTEVYRQPRDSPDIVATLWRAMAKDGAVRDTYRRLVHRRTRRAQRRWLSPPICAPSVIPT